MAWDSHGTVCKVILIGRLGQDPELKFTANKTAVTNLSLATTTKAKDNEKTEWHKIVVWGKTAEAVSQYMRKGSKLYIEGRLETRSWDDKNGNKKYVTEIIAENVQFLDGKNESKPPEPAPKPSAAEPPEPSDDLPF